MSLSSNPPSDWPAVSDLLDEALALPAHELDAWFDSLQGAQLAYKDEVRTLLGLRTFVDRENFLGQLPALKDPLPALPAPGVPTPWRVPWWGRIDSSPNSAAGG